MRRVIREGSIADKCVKASGWMDNSRLGNVLGMVIVGAVFCAITLYGFQSTHPFM